MNATTSMIEELSDDGLYGDIVIFDEDRDVRLTVGVRESDRAQVEAGVQPEGLATLWSGPDDDEATDEEIAAWEAGAVAEWVAAREIATEDLADARAMED